jgi:hypothetical protein
MFVTQSKILIQRLLIIAAAFSSAFNMAQAAPQASDLTKLKIYRNYYTINFASPAAHQIEVWFQTPDQFGFQQWEWDNIGIQKDQDLSTLTKDDFININVAIAGWPKLPENYQPIPAELESKRTEIETAIKRIHSDKVVSNIHLIYNGYRAKLDVNEHIPVVMGEDGTWAGQDSAREYFIDFNAGTMERIGSSGSGFGILFYGIETAEQISALKWFDFEVPAQIMGSSILSLDYDFERPYANQIHLDSFARLQSAMMQAAVQLQAGSAVNSSLESILAKQGDTVLPENFQQYFEFQLSGYGRTGQQSTAEQMDIEINFVVPFKDAEFSLNQKHEESGFEFVLSGNLLGPTPSIRLVISDKHGNEIVQKAAINASEMEVVVSGRDVMAMMVPLLWENTGEVSFPGYGEYSGFDFYTNNYLAPARLTGIELLPTGR